MKIFFTLLLYISFTQVTAQKIIGTVQDEKRNLLQNASIYIPILKIGASTNSNGAFSLLVPNGTYTVECSFIGFEKIMQKITVADKDVTINFVLKKVNLQQEMATVRASKEDYAYTIIRNAIKKKAFYNKQVNSFYSELYTKDLLEIDKTPNKIFGKKITAESKKDMGVDSTGKGIVYLSESLNDLYYKQPDKLKLFVKSSRISGSNGYGISFPTLINFNDNNVKIFSSSFNPRGFVSPIADNALRFYKYKFLGSYMDDKDEINIVQIIPKRQNEPLFTGTIHIAEDKWFVHSIDVTVTKKYQLEILDSINIKISNIQAEPNFWRVNNQSIQLRLNIFGFSLIGNFVNVFSKYKFNEAYGKEIFNNTIMKYAKDVNKKKVTYWDSIRPAPLTEKEALDFKKKDSALLAIDTVTRKLKMDSLQKKINKITVGKLLFTGINRAEKYGKNRSFTWGINGLLNGVEYNTAEGLVTNKFAYIKKYSKPIKAMVTIQPAIRYGFSNRHLLGNLFFNITQRTISTDTNFKNNALLLGFGKTVSQLNSQEPITPDYNSFATLLQGNNFLKNYEKFFAGVQFTKKYTSSLQVNAKVMYEERYPLVNTTNYTFQKKSAAKLQPNDSSGKQYVGFAPHNATIVSVDISYQPGQRFIEFPFFKMSVGSKMPTFYANYTKGIPTLFNSSVNFDKWKLGIKDDANFKLAGSISYNASIGGFINRKNVFIQDYQHFNGNQFLLASTYVNSFQLANYYENSTIANFYMQAHFEYHLNGLLTNKIPLFNKLNWRLVCGSNTFFVNAKNNYAEAFVGIENIFKIFRVDYVLGFNNGVSGVSGFRIGIGGLFNNNNQPLRPQKQLKF